MKAMTSPLSNRVAMLMLILGALGVYAYESARFRAEAAEARLQVDKQKALWEETERVRQGLKDLERSALELRRRTSAREMLSHSTSARVEIYDSAAETALLAIAAVPWDDVVLERDSSLQSRYLHSLQTRLDTNFLSLWRALGLADRDIQRFKSAMMENAERVLDVKAVAADQKLAMDDPAIELLLQQADEQLRAEMTAILGDDGYRQLKDFERRAPARDLVDGLAGVLAFTDSPLTANQADQLTQILVKANRFYNSGDSVDRWPQISANHWTQVISAGTGLNDPTDWSQVSTQAANVLSPNQLAVFQQKADLERTAVQIYNAMQRGTDGPVVGFTLGGGK